MVSPLVQCAAVRTHLLLTREPPHQTLELPDGTQVMSEDMRQRLTLADKPCLPGILIDLCVDTSNNLGNSVCEATGAVSSNSSATSA